ncbi:MAG TPA: ABC transporter substrate-binding protein [Ilumatobacteraceae bacterium]|nr:ABC transporter substrate-binding protein [Ilumatobacteraceae bacterium]
MTRCLIAVALMAGLGAAGCSSGGDAVTSTTIAATTTTIVPPADSDGRLVVGILLPKGDTVIGEPMVSAAELAIERINLAGGVLGEPVRPVVEDEGSTTGSASTAIQSLLARDVDVIVGPGSSTIALSTLDEIVSSGTLTCSPTASALALDGFPDDGLFFRTVPSDSLQAQAIADVADQTGVLQAAIVHIDDSYGRDFADSVETAIANGSISVAETITFTERDVDLTSKARQLLDSGAQVAIVLAGDEDGTRFLETLGELDTSALAKVVVNDAMRNPTTPQRIAGLDTDLREKIVGLAPQAESADPTAPFDPPGLFAANAFDCVNLVALAAVSADSDVPSDIAAEIALVSSGGSVCRTFADCVAALEADLQVDYNGPSGLTEIARTGDPSRAVFDRFVYDSNGEDRFDRAVTVGL